MIAKGLAAGRPIVASVAMVVIACATGSAAASPGWSYAVKIDLDAGVADVKMVLRDVPGDRVCADMDGAGVFVKGLVEETGGRRREVAPDPDETDCFSLTTPGTTPGATRTLSYRLRLFDLAHAHGDPDYAALFGGNVVWNDEAVFLRPDPLPEKAPIEVTFDLAPGIDVAAPWEKLDARRLRYDSEQYDAGAYVAVGRLHPLPSIEIGGGTVHLTAIALPRTVTDGELEAWVRHALTAITGFYGELPGGSLHLVLAPVEDSDESGVFGTVLRRGLPSVVLLFGARAKPGSFAGDWVAVHELFHLGNPRIEGKFPWFIEGFTTYFEQVLRTRSGVTSPLQFWADLVGGLHRSCDPEDGLSLDEESKGLRRRHRYQRVYWGGACLAFHADVAIREHSRGKRSLDDVLRGLRAGKRKWSEAQIVAELDREAGGPIVSRHLRSKKPIGIADLEKRLGIEKKGDAVVLHDDAPLAAIARAITTPGPKATTKPPPGPIEKTPAK